MERLITVLLRRSLIEVVHGTDKASMNKWDKGSTGEYASVE